MKFFLFLLYFAINIFLFISYKLLPEYRFKIFVVIIAYNAFGILMTKTILKKYILLLINMFRSRKYKYLLLYSFFCFLFIFLSINIFTKHFALSYAWNLSSGNFLKISESAKQFTKSINKRITVTYIKSLKESQGEELFLALIKEYSLYSSFIKYRFLHPVLDSFEYNELKNLVPAVSEGSIVVSSDKNTTILDDLSENSIISAFYKVLYGAVSICRSQGHKEPASDDYNENGYAITEQILNDRGVLTHAVDYKEWSKCSVLLINDPKLDFSIPEIEILKNFTGTLIILGGVQLKSIQAFLKTKNIQLIKNEQAIFSALSSKTNNTGIAVKKIIEHPVLKNVFEPILVANIWSVLCDDCLKIAAVSESLNNFVFVKKNNLFLLSGSGVASNFFSRYRGNQKFLYNLINYSVSPDNFIYFTTGSAKNPDLVVISSIFLKIINLLFIFILPIISLTWGVLLFLKQRT